MSTILYTSQDTDCLYTTVKNVSGKERVFGFLGARGKRLAANEVATLPGNLINHLGDGSWSVRRFRALERSLKDNESLEIVSTPSVHLYDAETDDTKLLELESGSLGVVDPCWELKSLSSSSSSSSSA